MASSSTVPWGLSKYLQANPSVSRVILSVSLLTQAPWGRLKCFMTNPSTSRQMQVLHGYPITYGFLHLESESELGIRIRIDWIQIRSSSLKASSLNNKFLGEILHLGFSAFKFDFHVFHERLSYDITISTKNKYFPKNTFFQKSVKNFPQKKTFYRAYYFFEIYNLENSWADKISLHGI